MSDGGDYSGISWPEMPCYCAVSACDVVPAAAILVLEREWKMQVALGQFRPAIMSTGV